MSRFGLVGGSYQSQTDEADAQTCLNLMVERDESGAGKSDLVLINTPGLSVAYTFPDSPIRGEWQVQIPNSAQRAFAVAGSSLYELFSDGTTAIRGIVSDDGLPVSFANSNTQVMIASGRSGYCLTLATNVLTGPIATIAGVVQVKYIDGFFAALIGDSAQWFVSTLADGTNWDPSVTTIVSVFADNIVSMEVLGRYICFFGKKKSVCYYDSGAANFPFDIVAGGFTSQGSAATFGIVPADNTLFGIWLEETGGGVAFRLNGNIFQRISTHPIELAWQKYSAISDAVGYSFQENGHTLIHWYFPTADKSWRYDVSTGLWHEVGFWNGNSFSAHRSMCCISAFGKHLVGDPLSGNIYQMSSPVSDGNGGWNFCTDFGNPIRRVRRSPYVGVAGFWNFFNSLEILADTGLGPNIPLTDGSGANRSPQLMIRWSKDGGNTWSSYRTLDMGQIGQFNKRMITRRLGKVWGSIALIFELSFTDAAPLRIVDADLNATPDMPPQKRIAQQLRERA